MASIQDRILLLFEGRASWSSHQIARDLHIPHEQIREAVRSMARRGWFNVQEYGEDLAVGITTEGKKAITDLKSRTR